MAQQENDREAFCQYLRYTPFASSATDDDKYEAFLRAKAVAADKNAKILLEFNSKSQENILSPDENRKAKAAARQRECRARRKRRLEIEAQCPESEASQPCHINVTREQSSADLEFEKHFLDNPFGVACSVCDRLWFQNHVRQAPETSGQLLSDTFPNEKVSSFVVCSTCYKSLCNNKIPPLSRSNGFVYPKYPYHLPQLDPIAERLVAPRLPFMQIRRLRFVTCSKSLIGQVINIPVDVNNMVLSLPRQLSDDYAFNVNIKRHQIHKSVYLSGSVRKGTVKEWLQYLLTKPLYKEYGITVDKSFFTKHGECVLHIEGEDVDTNEPIIELIPEGSNNDHDMLLAKQHTLMWSEEKYLDLALGMNKVPLNVIYDEHAEELSFPSIFLGEPRVFSIDHVTPFMMAMSEIRRSDRRGVKPEHVLYMASKVMRVRLTESMYLTFQNTGEITGITRAEVENKAFIEKCIEQNFSFMKSIPNSTQYWMGRKHDLFAMLRQLGKPSLFLTLSASEYKWSHLLRILYKLIYGREYEGQDPATELSSDVRTTLVNEDPVTCCIYFDKLVDTIMHILKSPVSPFGQYRVIDFFKTIEFQQRGSPHAHILLWLDNDPHEEISENMPKTVQLIDQLCTVNPNRTVRPQDQTHNHTFTCYKHQRDEDLRRCRFGAPFWPMKETYILIPMPKADSRHSTLANKYDEMHASLEFDEFDNLNNFLAKHGVASYEHYLNVLRAGINRPRVFLERTIAERWVNNFNPWISKVLKSNTDIQFILDPYSCATYVVEYVNKTNRGISNLHRTLIKLRDEYPDKDYSDLMKDLGIKMLNSVEMSSQEAAWYLLLLHMSESSRQVEYIPTTWPHDRQRIRKSRAQMEKEQLADTSTDIWKENIIKRYEQRPHELQSVSLAEFVAWYSKGKGGVYKRRAQPKVIRYRSYDMTKLDDYKREMVLLHIPFFNEEVDLLDCNKYRTIYDEREEQILEARKQFESDIDIARIMDYCQTIYRPT